MACHWCEISSAILGFAGAALLSVDAIYGRQRVLQERGKTQLAKARKSTKLLSWISAETVPFKAKPAWSLVRRTFTEVDRFGFVLMAAGFLCDLAGKW